MNKMQTPKTDGFYMPGEYEPHAGCMMIWPKRPGSWPYQAQKARIAFKNVIAAIAQSEKVYVAAYKEDLKEAKEALKDVENAVVYELESDDAWARDMAPTFVAERDKSVSDRKVRGIKWEFNAWGGSYNGLYASWEKDQEFAQKAAKALGYACYDLRPFVLEGGSIHSDGEGTILVTEQCLLSQGRNPSMSKEEIETVLLENLGAQKVIWLPRGIYQDETDEHVDNICAFIRPGEVVLAWTDKTDDPQYAMSKACLDVLEQEKDAQGRKIIVHKLPIPDVPICVKEEDLKGYVFEEGEDVREVGERLAASYVNFYFSNEACVVPAFGEENEESDKRAQDILKRLCPERTIIPVPAKDILLGGGNIHCITQQIPAGVADEE